MNAGSRPDDDGASCRRLLLFQDHQAAEKLLENPELLEPPANQEIEPEGDNSEFFMFTNHMKTKDDASAPSFFFINHPGMIDKSIWKQSSAVWYELQQRVTHCPSYHRMALATPDQIHRLLRAVARKWRAFVDAGAINSLRPACALRSPAAASPAGSIARGKRGGFCSVQ